MSLFWSSSPFDLWEGSGNAQNLQNLDITTKLMINCVGGCLRRRCGQQSDGHTHSNEEQVLKVHKILWNFYFMYSHMCSWVPPTVCGNVDI